MLLGGAGLLDHGAGDADQALHAVRRGIVGADPDQRIAIIADILAGALHDGRHMAQMHLRLLGGAGEIGSRDFRRAQGHQARRRNRCQPAVLRYRFGYPLAHVGFGRGKEGIGHLEMERRRLQPGFVQERAYLLI